MKLKLKPKVSKTKPRKLGFVKKAKPTKHKPNPVKATLFVPSKQPTVKLRQLVQAKRYHIPFIHADTRGRLRSREVAVLWSLLSRMRITKAHPHCYPSINRLALDCCMSKNTIRTALRGLEAKGVIQIIKCIPSFESPKQGVHTYILIPSWFPEYKNAN